MDIITFNNKDFKINIGKDNSTIYDSYKYSSLQEMKGFLKILKRFYTGTSISSRSVNSMINEWRVHNLLYKLHILRSRTKDVDLRKYHPWYFKVAYALVSPFYLHFI